MKIALLMLVASAVSSHAQALTNAVSGNLVFFADKGKITSTATPPVRPKICTLFMPNDSITNRVVVVPSKKIKK